MTLEQLRAELAKIQAKMEAVHAKAEADNKRLLSKDELQELSTLKAEADSVQGNINAKLARDQIAADMKATTGRKTSPGAPDATDIVKNGDPMGGFKSVSQFARDVRNMARGGGTSKVMQDYLGNLVGPNAGPTSFQSGQGGPEGGFLVPPAFSQQIWELVFDGRDLINQVELEPTASNYVKMNADTTTPWGASGIKAVWVSEGSTRVANTVGKTEQRGTELNTLSCLVGATDEILEDAPMMESRLTRGAARAIQWESSEAIMWGNGVGKPLGFMPSGAVVTQAKESGQAAATININNILKMISRLWLMGARNPLWIANTDIMPQVGTMTLGQNGVFFLPQQGFLQGAPSVLMGLPLQFSEHAKTLGTAGDLTLVDLNAGYYGAQKAGGLKYSTSLHLWFDLSMQAFKWEWRLGGQPFLKAPVTPANGSNTKSHFVALADRA